MVHDRISTAEFLRKYNVFITLVAVILFATFTTSGLFLNIQNLINVGERASVVGIIALGQMLVILTGGIDLSIGGIIAISLTVLAKTSELGLPPGLSVLAMMVAGVIAGSINGFLVAKTKVPPFMVTMGTMLFYSSLAIYITGASQLDYRHLQSLVNSVFSLNKLGERLLPTVVWLFLSGILIFVLGRTRFGHNVYAVGGKEFAAKLSGIRTGSLKVFVYSLSGLFSAVGALVLAYRLSASNPDAGTSFLMESIAAVVCGGTNINGGEGSIFGTLVGAIVMAALVNLLNLLNANPYIQDAIKGLMLIGFVFLIQSLSKRK